ncbi:hypothetical protein Cob_v000913 [Colletotrichum orbiculare MAFF 240422]|uniref:Postreplication repair E3 ubiquitin-protein ligase RAD18 n=1 Tax=Colletotrichum orbiculare (strain 104-T / ATCC 96160 / CBS 514.97 / LARS 414 / MAFF 240422) TaxID=1213857 RepID=N4UZ27_COLOR|nr:hypothetical protein Cob_v000913 [Colletotrichum orbiculare MAFF 240422]
MPAYYDEDDAGEGSPPRAPRDRKTRALKMMAYPDGYQRVTKLGMNTFGVNTGPLADGTDWSKLPIPIIREQLSIRGIPDHGKKDEIIERLINYKTYVPEKVEVRQASQSDEAFGAISRTISDAGERRFFVGLDNSKYISAAKRAMTECMCIVDNVLKDDFGVPNVSFKVSNGIDWYTVTIGPKTGCTCPAAVYNHTTNCKHVIYVLSHVLRAPECLLPQKTIFVDELAKILDNAPKMGPSDEELESDPAWKDGVVKPKNGKSCPVCYKEHCEKETVCCGKCGHHTHLLCFDIFKRHSRHFGPKCPMCRADWKPMTD